MGPLLFSLYMLPLSSIFQKYSISYHCYSDDFQLYFPESFDQKCSLDNVCECYNDIMLWLHESILDATVDTSQRATAQQVAVYTFSSLIFLTHLGYDLCKSAAGFVANPHLIFGRQRRTNCLQLREHRLVRKALDGQIRFARAVQFQMLPDRRVQQTLAVHKQSNITYEPNDSNEHGSCFEIWEIFSIK